MDDTIQLIQQNVQDSHTRVNVSKGKLDLIVLRYMARRLHLILRRLEFSTPMPEPLLYNLRERHGCTHRMAIYNYQELFLERSFMFVGFISRRQNNLFPSVYHDIQMVDEKLIKELVINPGILSYSSMQLRNGDWCNLVILDNADAKTYLKNTSTHKYAAHHLAHRYYEWIRLHNGVMPEGLDHTEMRLQNTKHYTFYTPQQRPTIRERTNDESYGSNGPSLHQSNYAFA